MAQDFYPFVDNGEGTPGDGAQVRHPARIAVYDDAAAAPRVVIVEPQGVREYLEEITLQVTNLSAAQGGTIPFMVIREIVENFIHAYFMEPTISILDHGNTLRFSDQGPGIPEKTRALQYGTTSATEEMRRYIRGVGSGLPYVQQYMLDKGGSLEIDDNISGGTVVTLRAQAPQPVAEPTPQGLYLQPGTAAQPMQPAYGMPWPQPAAPAYQAPPLWQQQQLAQQGWQQPGTWGPQPQPQPADTATWPTQVPQQLPPQAQQPADPQAWPPQTPQQVPAAQQAPWGAMPQPAAPATTAMPLSVRGRAILDYLAAHGSVGPSDLARTYGESQPTWTRELQALEGAGILRKDGQKRRLTALGQSLLSQ